jgi:hypothetical protein
MQLVAGINRTIHPVANIAWAPLKQVAPDVEFQPVPTVEGNGTPEEPMALAFTDPPGR